MRKIFSTIIDLLLTHPSLNRTIAHNRLSKGNDPFNLKLYYKAIEYYTRAIKLETIYEFGYAFAYNNRLPVYAKKGLYEAGIEEGASSEMEVTNVDI